MNPCTIRACLLASVLVTMPGAFADELHDGVTTVDEIVADTETEMPLRKVAAPIPFENFRYPFVDDAENVLFIGNDRYSFRAKNPGGIFRSQAADGRLDPMVLESDPAPDDGKPMGLILGLQTDRESFVFHRGPDRGTGIYARFGNEPLTTIAGLATMAPGASSLFDWFWYADVHDHRVVFHGTPQSKLDHPGGLYLYNHRTRGLRRLVDGSVPVPSADNSRFADFSYQPRIDASWLVFSANRLAADGTTILPGRGILGWPLDDTDEPEDPFAIERLQILAPFGMEIPFSGGLQLTAAPNPCGHDGIIAVVGGSDAEDPLNERPSWQSILVRTADGVWHAPVDTNTLIPGREDGAVFTGFNKWIAVQDGRVVFRAYGPGYEAVYLYDVVKRRLYFVADSDWLVDDKTIARFEIGRYPMVGSRLALMIAFRDGTSGVYLSTLHGLAEHEAHRK